MGKVRKNSRVIIILFLKLFAVLLLLGIILPKLLNIFLKQLPEIQKRPGSNSILVSSQYTYDDLFDTIKYILKKFIELNY